MQQNVVILLQLKDRRSREIWGKKKTASQKARLCVAVHVCVCVLVGVYEGECKEQKFLP